MSSRWCPSCGSEWWTDAVACRDCGAALVDEPPPEPVPDPEELRVARSHELAELDLPDVDQAGRWRLTLVLETNGVVHRWRGTTLLLPAGAVELVEGELAGIDQLAPPGDEDGPDERELLPLDDPGGPTGPPRLGRVGGLFADLFAFGLLYGAMSWIWGVDRSARWDGSVYEWNGLPDRLLWLYVALVLGYATVAVSRRGATLGMASSGVEVTDRHGGRLGWIRSLVRAVLALGWFLAPSVLPFTVMPPGWWTAFNWALWLWPIIVLGPALGASGLGLHDRAVGSVVRRKERKTRKRKLRV